jgi:hypothetical protein
MIAHTWATALHLVPPIVLASQKWLVESSSAASACVLWLLNGGIYRNTKNIREQQIHRNIDDVICSHRGIAVVFVIVPVFFVVSWIAHTAGSGNNDSRGFVFVNFVQESVERAELPSMRGSRRSIRLATQAATAESSRRRFSIMFVGFLPVSDNSAAAG